MGVLEARGVLNAVSALHDANRGELITTEVRHGLLFSIAFVFLLQHLLAIVGS